MDTTANPQYSGSPAIFIPHPGFGGDEHPDARRLRWHRVVQLFGTRRRRTDHAAGCLSLAEVLGTLTE